MSILVPFLLIGVVWCRHISYYDDEGALRPIISRSQEHRICAELCMSGLGGEPCGESCVDLTPQELPFKSKTAQLLNKTRVEANIAREGMCPFLCSNALGYPLCQCDKKTIEHHQRPDYFKICFEFCKLYNYQIYGCQACDLLIPVKNNSLISQNLQLNEEDDEFDWKQWCVEKCGIGEGGAACECDLLPMNLII